MQDRTHFRGPLAVGLLVGLLGLLLFLSGLWLARDAEDRAEAATPPCNGHSACLIPTPGPEYLIGLEFVFGGLALAVGAPSVGGMVYFYRRAVGRS